MEPPPPRDHFPPLDPGGGIHILDDHYFQEPHEEAADYEERRPQAQHRMSALSIHDGDFAEIRPRKAQPKTMDAPKILPDYLYYRLVKNGDDWSRAIKEDIPAPIDQIEKRAREKRGSDGTVLEQMTRMSQLRRAQLDNLVARANEMENGDARWEVAYIKAKKVIKGKKTKLVEVPEMDVILARIRKQSKPRPKSSTAEFVDIREPRPKPAKKEKQYTDDNYGHARKDSGLALLSDPIGNLPVFDRDGRPIDEHGPVQYTGLPPEIPRDKPLGAKIEPKKDKDKDDKKGGKRDKSQKRSQSRDKALGHDHDPDVVVLPEDAFDGDILHGDKMFGELKEDNRGRRGKSPHSHHDHPEVMIGDPNTPRSHSRRRRHHHAGEAREQSTHRREKSRQRGDSVHFPNRHTQHYLDASSISSEASDVSHYGYEYDGESSNTSLDTHGIPRRGSLVRHESHPDVVYKQHRRGPSVPTRHASYSEASRYYQEPHRPRYHEEARYVKPARTPRDSYVVYDQRPTEARYERPRIIRHPSVPVQIPEDRQLLYEVPAQYPPTRELVPIQRRYSENAPLTRYESAPLILHYPDEERDVYQRDALERQSGSIENYQRDRVREEFLNSKERDVLERERDLDIREDELRRLRRESRDFDDRDRRRSRIVMDSRTGQQYIIDD